MNNRFIVFEGLDGSGKETQTKLLIRALKKRGEEVELIEFPQYDKNSSALAKEYLSGKYGSAEEVGPKIASIFFACDRYDGSFLIKKWLKEEKFVIADRYVSSNAHQAGKIADKEERREFMKWLYDLEYGLFNLPRPDKVIYLKTTPEFAMKSLKSKKDKDIHEKDIEHLRGAYRAYADLVARKSNFEFVEVTENGQFLPPDEINKKILKILKK